MKEIFKSASRVGMLLAVFVTCIAFAYIVMKNATTDSVIIGVLTVFTNLITGITTFYYTKKQTNPEVDKI